MATTSKTTAPALCSLRLRISGVSYRVRPIEALSRDAGVARAFRLKRVGAEPITVADTLHGIVCDCGDYVFRHDGKGTLCKHARACRAVGLL